MLHRSLGEEIVSPSRQMMTKKALHIGQQVTKKSKQSKGWNEIRSIPTTWKILFCKLKKECKYFHDEK